MLDPSEVDRIVHVTAVPLMRLVDWKNRAGEPFELRCTPAQAGTFHIELNTPAPTTVEGAVPVVHGDYESRKEEAGAIVYKSLPGNSMGQVVANDGRPAFGVAFDLTEMDADGRPLFKVYFGSATEWFVKNVYHQKWNELREVKKELEPEAPKPTEAPEDERVGKERGRNPRDRARNEQRGGGARGDGQQEGGGRRRRGRRGGRGRGRGGGSGGSEG